MEETGTDEDKPFPCVFGFLSSCAVQPAIDHWGLVFLRWAVVFVEWYRDRMGRDLSVGLDDRVVGMGKRSFVFKLGF